MIFLMVFLKLILDLLQEHLIGALTIIMELEIL